MTNVQNKRDEKQGLIVDGITNEEDVKTLEAMTKYGGSFVKQLARLCLYADTDNLNTIKAAWAGYWAYYRKLAGFECD